MDVLFAVRDLQKEDMDATTMRRKPLVFVGPRLTIPLAVGAGVIRAMLWGWSKLLDTVRVQRRSDELEARFRACDDLSALFAAAGLVHKVV